MKTSFFVSSFVACATALAIPRPRAPADDTPIMPLATSAPTASTTSTVTTGPLSDTTSVPAPVTTPASTASDTKPTTLPSTPSPQTQTGSGPGAATKGLFVQFTVPQNFDPSGGAGASDDKADTGSSDDSAGGFASVLAAAVPAIEQEPDTLSWFGARQSGADAATGDKTFVVFDTFADDAGRAAHLAGGVAGSVIALAPQFVGGLSIDAFDILGLKSADGSVGSGVTFGLHTSFGALADDVGVAAAQTFCADSVALAQAEAGTVNWLCAEVPGKSQFVMLASFADQAARDTHLKGQVFSSLLNITTAGMVEAPTVAPLNIVAASVKSDTAAGAVPESSSPSSLTNSATVGLLVPFTARSDTADAVREFVQGATGLAAAEPGTLQWFGAAAQNVSTADLLVFDTFATTADRDAHLKGKVAAGLFSQIGALSGVDVIPYDILAIKSLNDAAAAASPTGGVTLGLRVFFNATSAATVPQVQDLCRAGRAQIDAEAGTLNWLCGQVPGTQTFLILDSFASEDARTAHINGKFATSLFATVGTLIDQPDIQLLEIFAGTVKPEPVAGSGSNDPAENGATTTTDAAAETRTSASASVASSAAA